MLAYSLKLCMSLMQNKQFRNKVLRVLVKIYMNLEKPDFINVCQVNFSKSCLKIIRSYSLDLFGVRSTCSVFCSVKWNLFSWLCAFNIYEIETNLKKRCKDCIFGQFIEKEICSKAVWGHRQLRQNVLGLCREYQMVGSQLGVLFIPHKNISSALLFW